MVKTSVFRQAGGKDVMYPYNVHIFNTAPFTKLSALRQGRPGGLKQLMKGGEEVGGGRKEGKKKESTEASKQARKQGRNEESKKGMKKARKE